MVGKLQELFQSLYSYFSSSLKWHLESIELVEIMKTKGLKSLRNAKTQWISMLEPLKHVLAKYKTLIVKMSLDNPSIVQTRLNLDLVCDIHTFLALSCWLPILESINALIKTSKGKDVFIVDFVVVVKICQVKLFMIYINPMTSY
jgi:hypothetical protein